MNSGTIAGLTSAPLKTKGINLIKNKVTFTKNDIDNGFVNLTKTSIRLGPTTTGDPLGHVLSLTYTPGVGTSLATNQTVNAGTFTSTNLVISNSWMIANLVGRIGFSNDTSVSNQANWDTILTRGGAANVFAPNLKQGPSDAAAPVSQTFSVQNGSGTNISGVPRNIDGCQSTGTGSGGSIVFRTAAAGTTGTAQNALTATLTIDPLVTTITNPAKIERAVIVNNANTTITLISSDAGTVINCTSSSPITVNLPVTAMLIGYNVTIIQGGTGVITFASNGQTLNAFSGLVSTAGQFASASVICTASTVYNLSGNLA